MVILKILKIDLNKGDGRLGTALRYYWNEMTRECDATGDHYLFLPVMLQAATYQTCITSPHHVESVRYLLSVFPCIQPS